MILRHRNPRLWGEILRFGAVCSPSEDNSREGELSTLPDGSEITLEGNGGFAHDAEGNLYCANYRRDGDVKEFTGYGRCTKLSSASRNTKEVNK